MRVVIDADAREKASAAVVPWMRDHLGPEIADRARAYVPKDTGALAGSIEDHMTGETLVVSATGGDDGRSYAAYIELGHRVFHPSTGKVGPEWVPAQPFLRPALFNGLWRGPVGSGASRARSVLWRPEYGFGGDVRNGSSVRQLGDAPARSGPAETSTRAHDRFERGRRSQEAVSAERHAKWLEHERSRTEELRRRSGEDLRSFTRDASGKKVYSDDPERKRREAEWFAEKWRAAHPDEPWSDAPPF